MEQISTGESVLSISCPEVLSISCPVGHAHDERLLLEYFLILQK